MSPMQKRFCQEYIIDSNAGKAALRAGYKNERQGKQLLKNEAVRGYIAELLATEVEEVEAEAEEVEAEVEAEEAEVEAEAELEDVAQANEVLSYLTDVMRGKSEVDVVVVLAEGGGVTKPETVTKTPDHKERLKAAELLGRNHVLFSPNRKKKSGDVPVVFVGEDDLRE